MVMLLIQFCQPLLIILRPQIHANNYRFEFVQIVAWLLVLMLIKNLMIFMKIDIIEKKNI
jgi:hypothetical protein